MKKVIDAIALAFMFCAIDAACLAFLMVVLEPASFLSKIFASDMLFVCFAGLVIVGQSIASPNQVSMTTLNGELVRIITREERTHLALWGVHLIVFGALGFGILSGVLPLSF